MLSILMRLLFHIWTKPSLTQVKSGGFQFPPRPPKKFGPRIVSAVTQRTFSVGLGQGSLLTDVVAEGTVQYKYVLAVHDFAGEPSMFIASESNTAALLGGSGSHSLSIFTPEGYENLGSSDAWGKMELFEEEAIKLVNGRTGVG